MAQTVIGIFDSATEANQAVEQLKFSGFNDERIDVSAARNSTGATTTDTTYRQDEDSDHDGIGGFFRSLFHDDEDNARAYSHVARHSDCVVTVHAQSADEAERAAEIMDRYGSVDVNERATQYGYAPNAYTGSATTDTSATNTTDTTSIPVIQENLEVGKREVQTGGARLRSRIVERPIEEHLRLRSEHIRVERRPVDRPATEADFNSFREGDIELTEHAEVPVVNKEARVVEEVSLNKEVEERDEVIRDTLRSTQVDVDRLDDTTRNSTYPDRHTPDLDNDRNTAL